MNNQKQFSIFSHIGNRTKKAIQVLSIVLAFVMLYEEASLTPPIIKANALDNNVERRIDNSKTDEYIDTTPSGVTNALINYVSYHLNDNILVDVYSNDVDIVQSSSEEPEVIEEDIYNNLNITSDIERKIEDDIWNNLIEGITITGYTTKNVNVRKEPSNDSDILDVYGFGKEIIYNTYDDSWVIVKYDENTYAYISSKYISDKYPVEEYGYRTERTGNVINVPKGLGTRNSFMGWQCVTSKNSPQYKLRSLAGQNFNEDGYGIINGRYCVATTPTYGKVGDYIDILRSDGTVLKAIIADIKNRSDYGCNMWGHQNGKCVVEFVVNKSVWYKKTGKGLTGYKIMNKTSPGNNSSSVVSITNMGSYFD